MDKKQKKIAQNKSVSRSFRCTQEEYETMNELAEKSGKKFSRYIIDSATKHTDGTDASLTFRMLEKLGYLMEKQKAGRMTESECLEEIKEEMNYTWLSLE